MCRRTQLDTYVSSCVKIRYKWTTDINLKPETLKLLEDNIDSVLQNVGVGKEFLNRTPFGQELRPDKWNLIKLKSYETMSIGKAHKMGEHLCQLHTQQKTDMQNIQETQKTRSQGKITQLKNEIEI